MLSAKPGILKPASGVNSSILSLKKSNEYFHLKIALFASLVSLSCHIDESVHVARWLAGHGFNVVKSLTSDFS